MKRECIEEEEEISYGIGSQDLIIGEEKKVGYHLAYRGDMILI